METAISALFDKGICVAGGPPELARGRLFPEEERLISGVHEVRRQEFEAGRLYARQALAELGFAPSPILAINRRPIWPRGTLGTITHKPGICGVAVAKRTELAGLGLDVERRDAVTTALHRHVLTTAELDWLHAMPLASQAQWATLIYSAKEAFYKSLAELEVGFVGFHDVRIELGPSNTFHAVLQSKSLETKLPPMEIEGRSVCLQDWVWTGVMLRTTT